MTPRNLTPASGRQDHTTLPSASASFVRALFARLTLPRPPHPAPNVRDDRETPLCVGRDGGVLELIWVGGEAEYFSRRGWTGKSVICPSGNHAFTYGPARVLVNFASRESPLCGAFRTQRGHGVGP